MKKIQILVLLFFARSYSQNEVNFKLRYQPETVYHQSTSTTTDSKTIYLGPTEVLERLKEKGTENPTIAVKTTTFKNCNTTGKLKGNRFSYSCEFTDFYDKNIIPDGTTIYGFVELGNKPEFDSLHSPSMLKLTKDMLFNTIKTMLNQLTFPEKKLKIGESFVREMPLAIPIGDKVLNMQNTVFYKLIKIEENLAYFDIEQNYTMDVSQTDAGFSADGKGTGLLVYDIKNTFYLRYLLDSNMHIEMNIGQLKIISKSKTIYEQITSITSNN